MPSAVVSTPSTWNRVVNGPREGAGDEKWNRVVNGPCEEDEERERAA
jgi:cell division protein FtsN